MAAKSGSILVAYASNPVNEIDNTIINYTAKHMSSYITRCPYCGSTDVVAGPYEMYCQDCGESWPNEESWPDEEDDENEEGRGKDFAKKAARAVSTASKIARKSRTITRVGLGGLVTFKGGKLISEIVKHMIF